MFWRKKRTTTSSRYRCLRHLLLYISLVSAFTLLLKAACVCAFFFLSLSFSIFCEVMPFFFFFFYQSNRLAAVFEWPRTSHTHLTNCTDSKNKMHRQSEGENEWGSSGRPGFGAACSAKCLATLSHRRWDMTWHWPCLHAPRPPVVLLRLALCFNCLQEPVTEPAWCYWFTSRPVF